MRLREIIQEGVFSDVKVKRGDADLSVLARLDPDRRSRFLRKLSDDEFWDLHTEQSKRFTQMAAIHRDAQSQLSDIHDYYPNDIELNMWQNKHGMEPLTLRGPVGTRDHHEQKLDFQVRPNTKAAKEVARVLKRHKQYERIRLEASLTTSFSNEATKRKQKMKQAANKAAEGPFADWGQEASTPAEDDNPKKLIRPGKTKPSLLNPAAYSGATEVFIGHPAHFENWSPAWKRRIIEMNEALKRNGKKGFTMMYASRIGHGAHKQPRGYFNFFMIGADGDFVWRKYQTSGANGGNWLYIPDTDRTDATTFESWNKERQDEFINSF